MDEIQNPDNLRLELDVLKFNTVRIWLLSQRSE